MTAVTRVSTTIKPPGPQKTACFRPVRTNTRLQAAPERRKAARGRAPAHSPEPPMAGTTTHAAVNTHSLGPLRQRCRRRGAGAEIQPRSGGNDVRPGRKPGVKPGKVPNRVAAADKGGARGGSTEPEGRHNRSPARECGVRRKRCA